MWVQKRGNKYRFFERYTDPITEIKQCVSCTLDKNNDKARRKAAAILQQKIYEEIQKAGQPGTITLQTLIDRYAEHQAVTVKKSTADRNAFEAAAVVRIIGPDSIVDRLTAAYVTDKLLSAGEAASCTNSRIKFLKSCIRWGYKSDLISSPALADKVDYLPDRKKKEKLAVKYMEQEELEAVLDAMNVTKWKLLTEFLCLSGLRIGELMALDDTDVGDKYIRISKTFDIRSGILSDTPKTDASNREVYIQEELAECIRQIRKERAIMLMSSGKRSSLFFPDADGSFMHYHSYNKYLGEITEKTIGRKLTPHACRHTMTSLFAAHGASLDTISRRLGHESSSITKEIYLHVTALQKKQDELQVDRIKILVGG